MVDETEMTPKPPVPAPTLPVDASAPVVTTRVSTQTESVSQGPESPSESTLGNQSLRGMNALIATACLGAGFLMVLAAIVMGTMVVDVQGMALIGALLTPLGMIVSNYQGQAQKKPGQ